METTVSNARIVSPLSGYLNGRKKVFFPDLSGKKLRKVVYEEKNTISMFFFDGTTLNIIAPTAQFYFDRDRMAYWERRRISEATALKEGNGEFNPLTFRFENRHGFLSCSINHVSALLLKLSGHEIR